MIPDISQLINDALTGDQKAFSAIVGRYREQIYHFVFKMVKDMAQAEDLTQETFIKAFRALASFNSNYAFSTWLYRIAINTSKNRLKSSEYRWKKKTVPIEKPEGSKGGNPFLEIKDDSPSPVIEFEKKERLRLIKEAINSLSEEQNRVIVLRDIQGLSYEEISDITGINLGTIKSRIARGRQELRDKLKGRI